MVSGIWELPFGKGKPFANSLNAFAEGLIGGWQISGVYTFQSGAPINFGNLIMYNDPSKLRLPGSEQTVERWFNTDAGFEKSSSLQLGSNVRWFPLRFGSVRADKTNNYDLSAIKNTRFKERYNVQFKAEFLNALNHPLFAAPNTTPTGSTFGSAITSTQANYPRRAQLTIKFIF